MLHVAIIWHGRFPEGMALTNRFVAFAKGLVALGDRVVFLCVVPAYRNNGRPVPAPAGTHEGIEFVFTTGTTSMAASAPGRILQRLRGFLGCVSELRARRASGRLDTVFFPVIPSWQMASLLLLGRWLGVPVVHEQNEHPAIGVRWGWLGRPGRQIYMRLLVRFCKGVEVISRPLEELYRPRLGARSKLVVVPAIVDVSRFERCEEEGPAPIDGPYVAWCGSHWGSKDGVAGLVGAFAQVASAHPTVQLVLIAPRDGSPDLSRVQNAIAASGLSDRVVITGEVSQGDMPRYLAGAAVLVLSRPASLQATYGFPTKLPEYLATGRPVVVTRVGDIPQYLKDKDTAYLVDPDDPDGFARALDYVLEHPEEARGVGQRGRALALQEFSNRYQAGRFHAFLEELA